MWRRGGHTVLVVRSGIQDGTITNATTNCFWASMDGGMGAIRSDLTRVRPLRTTLMIQYRIEKKKTRTPSRRGPALDRKKKKPMYN